VVGEDAIIVQKFFIAHLAYVPNFILEQMLAMLGQILARVHIVRFLHMMIHGPVEAGVVAARLLAHVHRVVFVHVRMPKARIVLRHNRLNWLFVLVLIDQLRQVLGIISGLFIRVHVKFMFIAQVVPDLVPREQDLFAANSAFMKYFIFVGHPHVDPLELFERHSMRFLEMVNVGFILA